MMERLKCVRWIEQSKSGLHQYGTVSLFVVILSHLYNTVGQVICQLSRTVCTMKRLKTCLVGLKL